MCRCLCVCVQVGVCVCVGGGGGGACVGADLCVSVQAYMSSRILSENVLLG